MRGKSHPRAFRDFSSVQRTREAFTPRDVEFHQDGGHDYITSGHQDHTNHIDTHKDHSDDTANPMGSVVNPQPGGVGLTSFSVRELARVLDRASRKRRG